LGSQRAGRGAVRGHTHRGSELLPDAAELIPARGGLRTLREAAAGCTACDLWRPATQTVFGAGTSSARLMLVGEQPHPSAILRADEADRKAEVRAFVDDLGVAARLLSS
jgi:hypothetical protein